MVFNNKKPTEAGEMKKKYFLITFVLTILLIASFLNIYPVIASDELFLVGIVKNIDYITGIVTVDIKTESCKGIRNFKALDLAEIEGLKDKKISFFIDSSICQNGKIYKMYRITLLRQRGKM